MPATPVLKYHTPPQIRPPFANYSFGVEVPPGSRFLICSGQLGIAPTPESEVEDVESAIPDSVEEQTRLCFHNIRAVLNSAGMDLENIVRVNAYVTGTEHLKGFMAARDEFVPTPPPASTLMVVTAFAHPKFKVEIEVIAADAGGMTP